MNAFGIVSTGVKQVWKDERNIGQPERSASRTGPSPWHGAIHNNYESNLWNGRPPLLLPPVQSGVGQLQVLPRPTPAYLFSFLRKIPNTSAIVSGELMTHTKESIPWRGGRGTPESLVHPLAGWAAAKGAGLERTWPWGPQTRRLLSDSAFQQPCGTFSGK